MCGIVGVWRHSGSDIDPAAFGRCTDVLAHRGPDGRGVLHDRDERLHLGHRRLAILDTSPAGAQPMHHREAPLVVVFNGEIYNFVELRSELERKGHRFTTRTDTEVLLAAFLEWGEDCQRRFNGMWAFAIWDASRRQLFCSRDRFGVKPFLYRATADEFAFGSELKVFAALPDRPATIDPAAFDFDQIELESTGWTLLEGVHALEPGHSLRISHDGRLEKRRWWSTLDHLPSVAPTYGEQTEEFRGLLTDACRIRMRSDVPLATSLSGGVDSSAVAAIAHRVGRQDGFTADWQRAFIQAYPGTVNDEAQWATQVAEHIGADIRWTTIAPLDQLGRLEESVLAFEQIHLMPLSMWWHYRAMREDGVLISLDGHGGDELLAGYTRFAREMRRRALHRGQLGRWGTLADVSLGLIEDHPGWGRISTRRRLLAHDLDAWLRPANVAARGRALLGESVIGPAYRAARRSLRGMRSEEEGAGGTRDARTESLIARKELLQRETAQLTPLGRALYSAFHHRVLPMILRNFDRLSMASGVEIRAPLLDWRLVTYAFALPDDAKLGGGFTKRILRDAVADLVPEPVIRRRDKRGFSTPMPSWLEGGLHTVMTEVVTDQGFLDRGWWDGPAIRDRVLKRVEGGRWQELEDDWPVIQAELFARGLARVTRSR
jgi:asparagine synthase (glutamine-hydrolysing)